jgi:hypothetical protein
LSFSSRIGRFASREAEDIVGRERRRHDRGAKTKLA